MRRRRCARTGRSVHEHARRQGRDRSALVRQETLRRRSRRQGVAGVQAGRTQQSHREARVFRVARRVLHRARVMTRAGTDGSAARILFPSRPRATPASRRLFRNSPLHQHQARGTTSVDSVHRRFVSSSTSSCPADVVFAPAARLMISLAHHPPRLRQSQRARRPIALLRHLPHLLPEPIVRLELPR